MVSQIAASSAIQRVRPVAESPQDREQDPPFTFVLARALCACLTKFRAWKRTDSDREKKQAERDKTRANVRDDSVDILVPFLTLSGSAAYSNSSRNDLPHDATHRLQAVPDISKSSARTRGLDSSSASFNIYVAASCVYV